MTDARDHQQPDIQQHPRMLDVEQHVARLEAELHRMEQRVKQLEDIVEQFLQHPRFEEG